MEQNLLNSSRYKISSMSIDSRFADQYADPKNPTANFTIRLPSTMRNIMRIRLSSVELPLTEPLFSESRGNISFVVDVSGSSSKVSIPERNYDISGFCGAIQLALRSVHPGFTCTPSADIMTITNSVHYVLHLQNPDTSSDIFTRSSFWGIGYYMGFRQKVIDVSGSVTGIAPILVNPTPYYLLQLRCPALLENITHRVSKNASIPAFAKLILKSGPLGLQFDDNSNLLRKEYTFLAPTDVFALNVRLIDPFGETITMRNVHWSMTFELTEVVNSSVASTFNQTYQRRT